MLFPTIRFAIFFVIVMPVSWLLMPLPSRRRTAQDHDAVDDTRTWLGPVALVSFAAVALLAPDGGWPTAFRLLAWAGVVVAGGQGIIRLLALQGLARWNVFMLLASYVFYGNYDWHFVALLAGSTAVNQVLAVAIDRNRDESRRRLLLIVAVVANLGVLAWFKYKGFFLESASSLLGHVGLDVALPGRTVIPPVGISFFTFQALSYVIDTYRRKLTPGPLLEFAVYLSFFPHLVAGPIVRAAEFLPQLRVPRDARRVDTGLAFWLITAGLFKKVVVADYLGRALVDPVFRLPGQHQGFDTLLGIYAYAIQIYCDFSGYTDMAIGLALLLGFRFPQNFDAPYTSASLQEFWRRWHMTLSRWLRDYLYIPLGGNQHGPNRAMANLFLTMLIGGLWHGAAWTFVVWGALHGGWLAAERWFKGLERTPADQEPRPGPVQAVRDLLPSLAGLSPTTRRWLGRLLTFHVVCLGWVFFRAGSIGEATDVLARLLVPGTGLGINLVVLGTVVVFLATQFVPDDRVGRVQARFSELPPVGQGLTLAFCLMVTSSLMSPGVAPFIYFAF